MNRKEIQNLLERLAGQPAPLDCAPDGLVVLEHEGVDLGYSQLNELLLLFGFDRISHDFFQFLLDETTNYTPGSAFISEEQLRDGVDRFYRLAILRYGNVKYAFKLLSSDARLLNEDLNGTLPVPREIFTSRHEPILPLQKVEADDAYLTGYLIERDLAERLKKSPADEEALQLEQKRETIVAHAMANQDAYLASDHLDVYVATSMREKHEFSAISRLTFEIFHDASLIDLKLRWFDPTQAYCSNRIDKGLSEALMLRRASCTIYLAQESDTLGKDSELASTLAQGKPVIAYIPEINEEYFNGHLDLLQKSQPSRLEIEILLDQLRIYEPEAAWHDETVRRWCNAPEAAETDAVRQRLFERMKSHYNKRAATLCQSHPLGIQVNLGTGVANGVLVVRRVSDCAKLIRRILLQELDFELDDTEEFIALRETISKCIFRVVTKDSMLTNTFWNFYLNPVG